MGRRPLSCYALISGTAGSKLSHQKPQQKVCRPVVVAMEQSQRLRLSHFLALLALLDCPCLERPKVTRPFDKVAEGRRSQ